MNLHTPSRTTLLLALLALTAAAYVQSFTHLFVIDDHDLLERVVSMLHSPLDAWKTGNAFQSYYRPVFLTSLWLDNALFSDSAAGYHVVNLLLHLGAVWCAFILAERLFNHRIYAALAAALFALHPTHTENVSWVSGRTDILCALFVFLALIEFHKLLVQPRAASVWLSALYFFLALGSKEVAVVLPVLCGVMFVFRGSFIPAPVEVGPPQPKRIGKAARRRSEMAKDLPSGNRQRVQVFLLYASCLGIFLWVRSSVSSGAVVENVFLTPGAIVLNATRCLAMYLWHAAIGGGFEYIILGWRVAAPVYNLGLPYTTSAWIAISATVVVWAAAFLFAIIKRRDIAVLGLAGFFLLILPALGFVPIISIFSVRFLYLPSFFLILAVLDGARALLDAIERPMISSVAAYAAVGLALWWGVQTFQQDTNWHDDLTLLESMRVQTSDSPIFSFCMGNGHRYRGEFMEAANNFARAVRRYPDYYDAYVNLGACYVVLGDANPQYYPLALGAYNAAMKRFPRRAQLFVLLGDAYAHSGDQISARQKYAEAYNIEKLPEIRERLRQYNVPVE